MATALGHLAPNWGSKPKPEGRLLAKPELRTTASGLSVTTVRIVTNDREQPEFHECSGARWQVLRIRVPRTRRLRWTCAP